MKYFVGEQHYEFIFFKFEEGGANTSLPAGAHADLYMYFQQHQPFVTAARVDVWLLRTTALSRSLTGKSSRTSARTVARQCLET